MVRSTLRFVFALLVLISGAAYSQNAQQGPGYVAINPPLPTASGDKVEVIEVFSYGCIHCAQFQPYVDEWKKKMDKSAVQFSYLPATFNSFFALMARGYYAAESLGVAEKTHQQVFNALFEQHKQVQSLEDLANLYASLGVDRNSFMQTSQSFVVDSRVRRANEQMREYRIDGTPTIIVAGKYRVTGETAGGHDKVFAIVDQLIAKEQGAKGKAR